MKPIILTSLLIATLAQGALVWEQEEIKLEVHPAQVSAKAVFHFSNTGKEPVTLSKVRVTCGCLAPRLAKRTYAPGESGELEIRFDLRNRTGRQRKATLVTTSDGLETKLYVGTDIPSAYVPAKKMIRWSKDDPAQAKTVPLVNAGAIPVRLLSVTSSHESLPVELKTIREGFEYEMLITRKAKGNARSVIRIVTEPPSGQTESKTLKLYVHAQ